MVDDIIRDAEKPVSAYAIVSETERLGSPMVPTQVYRSIDRLLESGKVERIATLKAFIPAAGSQRLHLICGDCGRVTSVNANAAAPALAALCRRIQFSCATVHLEIKGRCNGCTRPARARH